MIFLSTNIFASVNIYHNLGIIDFRNIDATPFDWAVEFDEKVKSDIINKNHAESIGYQKMNYSHQAVPTLDHYLPMIYVLGLQEEKDQLKFIYEGFHYGSISMRCFQIG